MPRSIGRRNIEMVREETKKAMQETRGLNVEDLVISRLPESLWDIWEGADSEIRIVIYDTVWAQ